MIERLLRAAAIAIALAALLDPPLEVTARPRPRIAVTLERPGDPASLGVRDQLAGHLRSDFDVVASGPDRDATAGIVIGYRYPDRPEGFSRRTSTVTIDPEPGGAGVRIASVRTPRAVPRGTRVPLEVTLESVTTQTSTSIVTVSAGAVGHPDVEVARTSHAWAADVRRVTLHVDAMPLDLPPWQLRVRVTDGGQSSPAVTSDVLVAEAAPRRVLFYEPRPSWIATFVRRALERDERFLVSSLDYPSRGIRIAGGDAASLDPAALRQVAAVIVGGLDRLTVADRDRLDRFVRERGGSLVLLPDARPGSAPWTEWLPAASPREVLLERPASLIVAAPLPPIQSSELLTFARATVPGAAVLARVAGSNEPVITMTPHGAGLLLVSGALDAWRYRADKDSAFDRFWRSTIAGVALATPAAVDVDLRPSMARPGETVGVVARIRRSALGVAEASSLQVSARLDSGEPIRLWPDAEADVFSGSFVAGLPADLPAVASAKAGEAGVRRVVVSAGAAESEGAARSAALPPSRKASADHRSLGEGGPGPREGSAMMAVDSAARHAEPLVTLGLFAQSHGGINVTPDHLADLEAHLRREISASPLRSATHPMRSGWWIVPFAACLSGEWWLRRRKGLR